MSAEQYQLEVYKLVVQVVVAVLTTTTTVLVAVLARRVDRTRKEVGALTTNVNGMKDELIASTARVAHAEGVAEGVAAVVTPAPVVPAPPTPANVSRTRRKGDTPADAPVKVEVVPSAEPLPVHVVETDEPSVPPDRLPRAARPPPYRPSPDADPSSHL